MPGRNAGEPSSSSNLSEEPDPSLRWDDEQKPDVEPQIQTHACEESFK